jgi:hypothetical protein
VMPEKVTINDDDVATIQVLDAKEALRMLATTEMKPFTHGDWQAFAGCESKDPMIGNNGDFVIILDGDLLCVVHSDDNYGGTLFKLYRQ